MIDKLEKKFGKYAIKGLMVYIIILYATGFILNVIDPAIYYNYLMLDIDKLLHGQVWRLFTFIIQAPGGNSIFWLIISLLCYYYIGTTLEKLWGSFRFNLYFLSGILFNILAVVLIYVGTYLYYGTGISYPIEMNYINQSLFLAFALMFPDEYFRVYFILPIKAKYIAIIYAVFLVIDIYNAFEYGVILGYVSGHYVGATGWVGGLMMGGAILVAMANFLIFFFANRKARFSQFRRKHDFDRKMKEARYASYYRQNNSGNSQNGDNVVNFRPRNAITRHKCAICGKTELDDENLEFRFCSKCNGNYEYCLEHLYTHTHVE